MPSLRDNAGLMYLAVVIAVPAFVLGALVGLSPVFTAPLVILVVAGAAVLLHWRGRRRPERAAGFGEVTRSGVLAAAAVFVAIQLVPYGRSHSNPPVTAEPAWPDAETRRLMVAACYDCHSNEVEYPWYSNVAPISWALARHVEEGRNKVNFSRFDERQKDADEVIEVIEEGSMPPAYFTRFGLHADAVLSDAERAKLLAALRTMPEFAEQERRGRDDD